MYDIIIGFLSLIAIALFVWFTWEVGKLVRGLIRAVLAIAAAPGDPEEQAGEDLGGMNEGDFHSGPDGYEPNTAYPESHYGEFGRDE